FSSRSYSAIYTLSLHDALPICAAPGDVLVVDNGGRCDESCVGDLVVLEAQAAGLGGIVIWGLHRDTADIRAIGLPVFSLGAIPTDRKSTRLNSSHYLTPYAVFP